jgi:hypothetical protein
MFLRDPGIEDCLEYLKCKLNSSPSSTSVEGEGELDFWVMMGMALDDVMTLSYRNRKDGLLRGECIMKK